MDTSQYLSMFLEESIENLQTLNQSLLDLEQTPEDVDKVNQIFRVAHTLKGMAATMGYTKMAELTHKMEDVLAKFREGQLSVTHKVVNVLFDCLDTLEKMVNNIEEGLGENEEIENIITDLEQIGIKEEEKVEEEKKEDTVLENSDDEGGFEYLKLNEYDSSLIKSAAQKNFNAYKIKITISENTLLKSARAFLIYKDLEENGEIIKCYPSIEAIENEEFEYDLYFLILTVNAMENIKTLVESISEVREVEVRDANETTLTEEIEVQNIKEAEVVAEEEAVVNVSNSIEEEEPKVEEEKPKKTSRKEVVSKKSHQSVRVDLERIDMLMNMVSELVIYRTRLEQISMEQKSQELTETLEQVGRTTSDLQDLVMKIRMLPLEVVFNRFPRMIRDVSMELNKEINFIIEGAETELDRTVIDEIGEPLIHLLRNAADHGVESKEERIKNGKNPVGTVKLVAYQEGTKALIKVIDDGSGIDVDKVRAKANKVGINTDGMSENEIKNLIFAQGFSTNEVVTDISGRGVGMDVVKTKIASLGGTVDVISKMGVGSEFIIKLPLTLQIIQALLVKVGQETLAISLGFIDRVIDYNEEKIKRTNGHEVIINREKLIPLIRLNEKLDIEGSTNDKKFVIIVNVGDKTVGLLVDSLVGQQEIVIKPLGKTLKHLNEYIGATILGNGLVTLILDVAALITV